jgi:hypothetical protein
MTNNRQAAQRKRQQPSVVPSYRKPIANTQSFRFLPRKSNPDLEHFQINGASSTISLSATAGSWRITNALSGFSSYFLPGTGYFIEEDEKFNFTEAKAFCQLWATNAFSVLALIAIKTVAAGSITDQDLAQDSTKSLEDLIDAIPPHSDFDYQIVTPVVFGLCKGGSSAVLFENHFEIDLKPLFHKIHGIFYKDPPNFDRVAQIYLLSKGTTASQSINYNMDLIIHGKRVLERSTLLK